jgi:HAD superfamily hydrolase (TIGR01549 family)
MDGVLLDAMPFHADAFQKAFKKLTDVDIDKKDIYLLEGMPGPDLIKKVLKKYSISYSDEKIIEEISELKKELFKKNEDAKAFEGVKEILRSLEKNGCIKAVVSGASENEVKSLLEKNQLLDYFDLIISGEDIEDGKPSAEPFIMALNKINLSAGDALVVENSPLGVNSAVKAGIKFIVTLNNTPLLLDDFQNLPQNERDREKVVFKDTKSASDHLYKWSSGNISSSP